MKYRIFTFTCNVLLYWTFC